MNEKYTVKLYNDSFRTNVVKIVDTNDFLKVMKEYGDAIDIGCEATVFNNQSEKFVDMECE